VTQQGLCRYILWPDDLYYANVGLAGWAHRLIKPPPIKGIGTIKGRAVTRPDVIIAQVVGHDNFHSGRLPL